MGKRQGMRDCGYMGNAACAEERDAVLVVRIGVLVSHRSFALPYPHSHPHIHMYAHLISHLFPEVSQSTNVHVH